MFDASVRDVTIKQVLGNKGFTNCCTIGMVYLTLRKQACLLMLLSLEIISCWAAFKSGLETRRDLARVEHSPNVSFASMTTKTLQLSCRPRWDGGHNSWRQWMHQHLLLCKWNRGGKASALGCVILLYLGHYRMPVENATLSP